MDIEITVTYDNNKYMQDCGTGWGFSCFIRGAGRSVLFDTGGDGTLLLKNMKRLRIDTKEIDIIFLSHNHEDHVGGLQDVLQKNNGSIVYLPQSFPADIKNSIGHFRTKIVEVLEHGKLCKNVFTTGELGTAVKEQSLIIRTAKGCIVITGCAHPGIVSIVKHAKDLIMDDVFMVIGGYHLGSTSISEIKHIISGLQGLGVRYIGPCHCTGDTARQLFRERYRENYITIGAGRIIETRHLTWMKRSRVSRS